MTRACLLLALAAIAHGETVDHRNAQSPVKNQAGRGTCTAFAVAAALETFPGFPHDLSEQWLYGLTKTRQANHIPLWVALTGAKDQLQRLTSEGLRFSDYVPVLRNYGLSYEKMAPYDPRGIKLTDELKKAAPTAQRLAQILYTFTRFNDRERQLLQQLGKFRVTEQENIDFSALRHDTRDPAQRARQVAIATDRIRLWLHAGHHAVPAWYAIDAAKWSAYSGKPDVPVFTTKDLPRTASGHAVTIVGYTDEPGRYAKGAPPGKYFLVKNSWGPRWGGLGGYALLSVAYHHAAAVEALLIGKTAVKSAATKHSPFDTRSLLARGAFHLKLQPARDGVIVSSWLEEPEEANVGAVRYVLAGRTFQHLSPQLTVPPATDRRVTDRSFRWRAPLTRTGLPIRVLAAYYEPLHGGALALRAGRLFDTTWKGHALDLVAAPAGRLDAARTQAMLDQARRDSSPKR